MKKTFLFAAACITSAAAFSQSFQHGIGASTFIDKVEDADIRPNVAITYSPRYNFVETQRMSVSVGIPLSVGLSFVDGASTSSTGEEHKDRASGFMVNAPLMVSLNLGGGSSRKNTKRVGGFIGGGFGYHYTAATNWYTYNENFEKITKTVRGGSTMGPAVNAGIRVGTGRGNYKQNIEVRFSYFRGTTQYKMDLYGVGCSYNF